LSPALLLALALVVSGERSAVSGSSTPPAVGVPVTGHGSPRIAQSPLTAHRSPLTDGSHLTVYLLTFGLGEHPWERFGHNAIRIRDTLAGTDVAYDWGRFDFGQANFAINFARGRMRYWMDTASTQAVVAAYVAHGRRVWMQELEIPPARRLELQQFLAWNVREENKFYDYDYYLDNCSTRIRDALDVALGGALKRWAERPSGVSWRQDTKRLNQHSILLHTGLMLALGRSADREMTRWQQMFLPVRLREMMDSVRVVVEDGSMRSAVRSQAVLAEGGRFPEPARPADWTLGYLGAGVVLGLVLAGLGRHARAVRSGSDAARAGFIALGTLWALLAGVIGLLLAWLWAFSSHTAAHRNENLLLFNVLAFALAVVLPAAVRGRPWAILPARRLALAVAALAALNLLLKLLPGDQANLELIALALPAHAGLALGLSSRRAA
jgi:hypothetical protein